MLNNDYWELSYHTWSLGHTLHLDILLCCEVLSLVSSLSSFFSLIYICNCFLLLISLTYRSKQLGPLFKLVMCTCLLPALLILWPVVGIVGSIVGGAAYGFFSPIVATFEAVEGGKENKIVHCFIVCFISELNKILVILFSCCCSTQKFHVAPTGWNLEHCFKDFWYCQGCRKCMLPYLFLGYGWPKRRGKWEILWNQVLCHYISQFVVIFSLMKTYILGIVVYISNFTYIIHMCSWYCQSSYIYLFSEPSTL